ncbi:endonuclease/exonuclease/phosphatase family protein [Roseococcus microcysteis]|uniref:endonuclease/exonuclease/phosphatase family protein n=1 Tax=Roseococcus microcysteis TaxID=2771361 RepID=UPI00168A6A3D|nr:endonuclease/exonuclease/phosphatase family protein [Roseococcus microcysteis]
MRVATWNIHGARGVAGWPRPGRILDVLAEIRPDVIALQEAQSWLRPDMPMLDEAALATRLDLLVLRVVPGQQGYRGNLLLARRGARLRRGPVGLRLGGAQPRGAILAELDLGAGPFRVIGTHLSLGAARRREQAGRLLAAALEPPRLPVLIMGDLNERRVEGAALAVLAGAFGVPPAAPSFPALLPRLSLDRILGHPAGVVTGVAVHDTPLARRASDHLPLVARIALPGA